ncbi:hypothetical protein [Luteococcus peritonei]|uniref:DUF4157 domain-containing protein n=1 Tax=Luteococcus peritonei TaxID=88874 RepID=A0ABW4RQZ7_9ACTN
MNRASPGRLPASPAMVRVRQLGNWLNLSTPLGLAVALAGGARLRRGPRKLWLAEGYRLRFPVAGAFTIGNVVTTSRPDVVAYLAGHPGLLEHEESHSWQWTMCLGLPFLPLYATGCLVSQLRHGDLATGNPFERQADLVDGGYRS